MFKIISFLIKLTILEVSKNFCNSNGFMKNKNK